MPIPAGIEGNQAKLTLRQAKLYAGSAVKILRGAVRRFRSARLTVIGNCPGLGRRRKEGGRYGYREIIANGILMGFYIRPGGGGLTLPGELWTS